MGAIITGLGAFLLRFLGTGFVAVLGIMFSDVVLGLIGQGIDLVSNAVTGTSVELPDVNTSIEALPAQVLVILKLIRLDDALGIIVAAVLVRGAASAFSFIRTLRRGVTP